MYRTLASLIIPHSIVDPVSFLAEGSLVSHFSIWGMFGIFVRRRGGLAVNFSRVIDNANDCCHGHVAVLPILIENGITYSTNVDHY